MASLFSLTMIDDYHPCGRSNKLGSFHTRELAMETRWLIAALCNQSHSSVTELMREGAATAEVAGVAKN
jgi:hypothetical protein